MSHVLEDLFSDADGAARAPPVCAAGGPSTCAVVLAPRRPADAGLEALAPDGRHGISETLRGPADPAAGFAADRPSPLLDALRATTMTHGGRYVYGGAGSGTLAQLVRLGEIEFWYQNREVDEGRAAAIAAGIAAAQDFGPNPIVIAEVAPRGAAGTAARAGAAGGQMLAVDGQHRLRACQLMGEDKTITVPVCVCRCDNERDVRALFRIVNAGTPVPLSYYDEEAAAFAEAFADMLVERWPGVEGKGSTAQRPRHTRRGLIDHICSLPAVREGAALGRLDASVALRLAVEQNAEMEVLAREGSAVRLRQLQITQGILARAERLGFYLGLRPGWSDGLIAAMGEAWRT